MLELWKSLGIPIQIAWYEPEVYGWGTAVAFSNRVVVDFNGVDRIRRTPKIQYLDRDDEFEYTGEFATFLATYFW